MDLACSMQLPIAPNLKKIDCNALYRARPPGGNGWPGGVILKGNCPLQNQVKEHDHCKCTGQCKFNQRYASHATRIANSSIGQSSVLLNPLISDPEPVPGQTTYPPRLDVELPQLPPSNEMRLTTELELQVIRDLFIVGSGVGRFYLD